MRIDKALVVRGLCRSRAEAQAALDGGVVTLDGALVSKASLLVSDEAVLAVAEAGPSWVSRAAPKLDAALTQFGIAVAGRAALDVGASTGGFTECLLRRGAVSVYAIDVGHGQMVSAIAADPRVCSREGVNARSVTPSDFPHPFDIIVADLSFISLTLVLPALAPLLGAGGDMVCLVKPQFEVGASKLGKGGIVRDPRAHEEALARVVGAARACGLLERGRMPSTVEGAEGNREFLVWLKTGAGSGGAGGE